MDKSSKREGDYLGQGWTKGLWQKDGIKTTDYLGLPHTRKEQPVNAVEGPWKSTTQKFRLFQQVNKLSQLSWIHREYF